ncbi:DUF1206 domain-containing protein [Amnibacterium sp. CER49]|uniref:DUF1206 domain-containing protein n=1 Tax=Amnibacterium sp. CER49 TaxID=3039161 RepID=UPI00244D3996|nr:DUF1206 domain-containing protein [Amnibacterium sp. CER49]MDH2444604.1 DUF1206 domain-containing protein [Amnibacterium sp. CER49]
MPQPQQVQQQAEQGASAAKRNPAFQAAARTGFAVSGLIQLLVGVFALQIATGGTSGGSPDQTGAFSGIAKAPGGAVLLWIAVLGSFALAVWYAVDGALVRNPDAKKRWTERGKDWAKALLYLVIAFTALRFATGSGSNASSSSKKGSADVLSLPGGPVLLLLVALVVVAIGVGLAVKGIKRGFEKDIDVPSGQWHRPVVVLGEAGYIARGVAVVGVGVLLAIAALTTDPKKATGLDGSIHAIAHAPAGGIALVVIAIGWIAAGLYGFVRAARARMD